MKIGSCFSFGTGDEDWVVFFLGRIESPGPTVIRFLEQPVKEKKDENPIFQLVNPKKKAICQEIYEIHL
jgi:hypothetical protein